MINKKNLENIFSLVFTIKSNAKLILVFNFLISFFLLDISKAEINNFTANPLDIEYLKTKNELDDYIIDYGDTLSIDFQFELFDGKYNVSPEGELLLPEIGETYVRGLTPPALSKLLTNRYSEIMVDPEINVRIEAFKSLRILIEGEIRNPGLYTFPSYSQRKDYLSDPILTARINFEGTLNILNMAKDQKAKVLYTSSSEVYGDCEKMPQDENFLGLIRTTSPRSCYAHGKRIAETLCFDYQRQYKTKKRPKYAYC